MSFAGTLFKGGGSPRLIKDLIFTSTPSKPTARAGTIIALPGNTLVGNQLIAAVGGVFPDIDGVAMVINDSLLVKDEVDKSKNGIYILIDAGGVAGKWILQRSESTDTSLKMLVNSSVWISEGATNADTLFTLTTDAPIVLNTTGLTFVDRTTTSIPGGADTEIQFNDGGILSGSSDFTFNKVTKILTVKNSLVVNDINANSGNIKVSLRDSGVDTTYSVTSDNGGFSQSWQYITFRSHEIAAGATKGMAVSDGDPSVFLTVEDIVIVDNSSNAFTTSSTAKTGVIISSKNSTISAGISNVVIIGGSAIIATVNDTVYISAVVVPNVSGGEASGGNLTLLSTSNATKGKILFGTSAYDELNNALGIGTVSPNASAILHLSSTTKGFLPPKMTTTQRDAIVSPAKALIIYNTTVDQWQGNNNTQASPNWVILG